jgi:hypothetical protein
VHLRTAAIVAWSGMGEPLMIGVYAPNYPLSTPFAECTLSGAKGQGRYYRLAAVLTDASGSPVTA